ncbi:MAG: hypothetical protein IPG59_03790 [Candidatus Melainabacteria bacterium]|nr:MAG: hypothetical protein IPG59_03790 [Candidatus Melainabacteria bacterium]
MAAEEVKPEKAAATPEAPAAEGATENSPARVEAAATEKIRTEVTESQRQQQGTLNECIVKEGAVLAPGTTMLEALTSGEVDKKLGGDCAGTEQVADLRRKLGPASEGQQVKLETRPDGTRVETRFENDKPVLGVENKPDGSTVESRFKDGRLLSVKSTEGDKTSLKSFDESGNLTTTLIESGTGADKVQTWSFAGGDNLVIRADGRFNGTINGRAVEGKGQAAIEGYFNEALTDEKYVPDVTRDSFGADTHGSSMIISGDTRTGAIIGKSGDLNILAPNASGEIQRNIATFSGDTMTLHGPNGAVTEVKAQSSENGKYVFNHNGITYTVQNDSLQQMKSMKGNVEQIATRGPKGWSNEAIERPVDESGNLGPENRVRSSINEKGELQTQVMDGDKPVQTTIITPESRITYKGDGTDRSLDNILMRATNNSLETPDIVRNGNMVYDRTGGFSDKDGAGVYYDVVSGRNLTNTQLLQFASFAAAMSSQVSSFQNFFESVAVGANDMLGSVDARIGQIQAFIGFVNCNVNGSRYLGLLVPANGALVCGIAARERAGVCVPDQVATENGLNNPGLVARTPEDVCQSPSLALINGGKTYESLLKDFPALQVVKKQG